MADRPVAGIAAAFTGHEVLTVGLEEEVFLVDADQLRPASSGRLPLEQLGPGFKQELPADQLELVTRPAADPAVVVSELAEHRRALLDAAPGTVAFGAGVNPTADAQRALNRDGRYGRLGTTYGPVASVQQVASLHVHVAVPLADVADFPGIFNRFRRVLPELAALAANAPVLAGHDTGLASVRPLICGLLPRQGLPDAMTDWAQLEAALEWVRQRRSDSDWWWELRANTRFGTLEFRVFDSQSRLQDVAGLVTLVACLARQFLEDPGSNAHEPSTWQLAEERFEALRFGARAICWDADSDSLEPVADRIARLIAGARSHAGGRWEEQALDQLGALIECPGFERQRRAFREHGADAMVRDLTAEYAQFQLPWAG